MIYYQTEEHVLKIRRSNDSDLERYHFKLDSNEWVSILDYLHSFSAKYDIKEMEKIYYGIPIELSERLQKHYDTRQKHHIECLLDGLIKHRCLLDRDMSFEAKEEDYKNLRLVWDKVIRSWITKYDTKKMDIKERVNFLSDNAQKIYAYVVKQEIPIIRIKLQDHFLKIMSKHDFMTALLLLIENELLIDKDQYIRPYFMDEIECDKLKTRF